MKSFIIRNNKKKIFGSIRRKNKHLNKSIRKVLNLTELEDTRESEPSDTELKWKFPKQK